MKKMSLLAGVSAAVFSLTPVLSSYVSAQSPVRLTNIPSAGSSPGAFATYKGRLFFSVKSGQDGAEVYSTDGSAIGTILLKNINTTAGKGSDPGNFTDYNNKLYFGANDGTMGSLWVTDGTSKGTTLIKKLTLGSGILNNPQLLTVAHNKLYFIDRFTPDGSHKLWVSDGTAAGTKPLSEALGMDVGRGPTSLKTVGNKLFYATGSTNDLWVSDETAAGTKFVKGGKAKNGDPLFGDRFFNFIGKFTPFGDKLMFRGYDQTATGDEPWISNGTPGGTYTLDLSPGFQASLISEYCYYNGKMYFPFTGLWVTDGTQAGSKQVKNVLSPQKLTVFNGKLYFAANTDELWTSDGTEAGTKLIKKLNSGTVDQLIASGDKLYFSAAVSSKNADLELWRSDGTGAGTWRVSLFNPYANEVFGKVKYLINSGDQLYFTAQPTGLKSPELYRLKPNQAPVAPVIANAAGTVGKLFHQSIPLFKDPEGLPLFYKISSLPANLKFDGGIIEGVPTTAGIFSVTVTATDISGLSASATYKLTINPAAGSAFALQAPTYTCQTGAITFKTSGGDGSSIEYQAAGITSWTTNPNQFVDKELLTANDVKPFTLQARQHGIVVSYIWDMKAYCAKSPLP